MTRALSATAAIIAITLTLLVLAGCGGGTVVNTSIFIPDLDRSQYTDSYYEAGWQYLKQGKPDLALKSFEMSNSEDQLLYVGFGYAFLAKNKPDMAKRNFEKCLDINPDNLQAHFGLATMFEQLNDLETAFRIYSKLRAAHPENSWVKVRFDYIKTTETERYLKEAEMYNNQDSPEGYIGALEKASGFSPEMVELKMKIGDYYSEKEIYDQAAPQYEALVEKQPNDEMLLTKLAGVYEKMKKYDSAVLIYRRMLEFKPGDLDITNKINNLKMKFYELNLPAKFKNIFFKDKLTREDLAALLGYYFDKYLEQLPPVIITDIGSSFAKSYIIKVCTLEIMKLRPDHSFDRYSIVNRAVFAVVMDALLRYLESTDGDATGNVFQFEPPDEVMEPVDISTLHKDYNTIKFLVNSGIMKLNAQRNFNPTDNISPSEALVAIRKILNSMRN